MRILLALLVVSMVVAGLFFIGTMREEPRGELERVKVSPESLSVLPTSELNDLKTRNDQLEAKLRGLEKDIRDRDGSIGKLSDRLGDLEKRLLARDAEVKDLQDVALKVSQAVTTMTTTDKSRAQLDNLTKNGISSERSAAVVAFQSKVSAYKRKTGVGREAVLAALGKAAPQPTADPLDAEITQAGGLAAYVTQGLKATLGEEFPKFEELAIPRDPSTGEFLVGLKFMDWGQDNPGLVYWRQFLRPE